MNYGARGVAGPTLPGLLPQDEKQQAQFSILLGAMCIPQSINSMAAASGVPIGNSKPKPWGKGILGNVVPAYLNSFHLGHHPRLSKGAGPKTTLTQIVIDLIPDAS